MKTRVPDWLVHLLKRPAAVFGAGVSGQAAAALIVQLGGKAVIYDRVAERMSERNFGAGEAQNHGLVVVSPGFPNDHPWLRAARSAGCEVLAELDLGALAWPGEMVAITGTNGKTTLTEFLTHALKTIGRDARAVGNIGVPLSDAWRTPADENSIAICEVSSFQAEVLRFFEATATLWSNFAEDHLERHGTLEAYFRAKYNVVKHTRSSAVFFGPSVTEHARDLGLELPISGCVPFATEPVDPRLDATIFGRAPQRENFLLARAWWRHAGFADEALLAAAASFRLGPHRLSRTGEMRGVTFWNDSKATNFHAVEAALASFERPVLWLGGGRSKGGDLAGFARRIAPFVRQAFLIGETRDALAIHLREHAVPVAQCGSLREAVALALSAAASGDHVLLSPAFASFDMFNGYDDRGRRFEAIVADLTGRDVTSRASSTSANSSPNSSTRPAPAGLSLS